MKTVRLEQVTRDNWQDALTIKVRDDQSGFVPSVAVSLAKVHIKPDGDNVTYLPFAIYAHDTMVGFLMQAYEEDTTNMYWINGFIIDVKHQGKGYGKASLAEIVRYIKGRFPQCEEVRLTVYPQNKAAQRLYSGFGFEETGERFGEELVYRYKMASLQ